MCAASVRSAEAQLRSIGQLQLQAAMAQAAEQAQNRAASGGSLGRQEEV
jgi:hypothetical protein